MVLLLSQGRIVMCLSVNKWIITAFSKHNSVSTITVIDTGLSDIFQWSCLAACGFKPLGSAYDMEDLGFKFVGINRCSGLKRSNNTPILSQVSDVLISNIQFPSDSPINRIEITHEVSELDRCTPSVNSGGYYNWIKSLC